MSRGGWGFVGLLLAAAVVFAGCAAVGGARGGVSARQDAACGSGRDRLSAQDLRYAGEYHRLLAAKAATVWPGWSRVPPLLQRKGRCEYLVGHAPPPRGLRRVPGVSVAGRAVYAAAAGALTPAAVAAPWRVGSTWVAMVPTRDELQRAVDRRLGRGAVRLDDTGYVRSLVHEAFHAHQMTAMRGALPTFGATLEERRAVDLLARLGKPDARLAAEGRALAAAVAARSLQEARAGAAAFATLRAKRRSATADGARLAAFERQLEWTEGTARYADVRLLLAASAPGYTPTRGIRYTPAGAYRRAFLAAVADPARRPDGLHGRWRDLGAAEALLLDRLAPGWKHGALPGGESLEGLLRRAQAAA